MNSILEILKLIIFFIKPPAMVATNVPIDEFEKYLRSKIAKSTEYKRGVVSLEPHI